MRDQDSNFAISVVRAVTVSRLCVVATVNLKRCMAIRIPQMSLRFFTRFCGADIAKFHTCYFCTKVQRYSSLKLCISQNTCRVGGGIH